MEFTSPYDFWPSLKNLAHYKYQADGRQLLLAITLHHRTKARYVIGAVNFYCQCQDLDWLIFVCCHEFESFANTRLGSCDDLLQSILLSETGVFPTD